ncbi:YopN family type III secretion system gatekeeper subunit, partial [Vibrio sp. 780]|nr:YopN family type III secretion system gatekeeper subunit [Vibrio sp. 780]
MSIINSQIATNTKFDASVRNGLELSRADSAVKGSY